jgi:hypothetical protein
VEVARRAGESVVRVRELKRRGLSEPISALICLTVPLHFASRGVATRILVE